MAAPLTKIGKTWEEVRMTRCIERSNDEVLLSGSHGLVNFKVTTGTNGDID